MAASGTVFRLDDAAQGLFEVATRVSLAILPGRRRGSDLKELEYLTLAVLLERGTMIVGHIQRLLGVLPAQMSRIIRALENRDRPLITCQINPRDKRKIDVTLTDLGEKAVQEYQAVRAQRLLPILRELSEEDCENLEQSLGKLRGVLGRGQSV